MAPLSCCAGCASEKRWSYATGTAYHDGQNKN
jgi:hypothetical protein